MVCAVGWMMLVCRGSWLGCWTGDRLAATDSSRLRNCLFSVASPSPKAKVTCTHAHSYSHLRFCLTGFLFCSYFSSCAFSSPPVHNACAMVIVHRIRVKTIRTVLCCVVYNSCANWLSWKFFSDETNPMASSDEKLALVQLFGRW